MVRKLFKILHREFSGLHEAAFLLGLSTLASQFLALFRDRLLASTFGAGRSLDIYYAAFRIPDIIFVTVASFVAVTVLIPFIIERISDNKRAEAYRFLNTVLTYFFGAMMIVLPLLAWWMPSLARIIAPGFAPADLEQLVMLSRIMLLSPLFLGLSNLIGSLTQATHKFFIYALSPVMYNLGVIIGVVVFYPMFGLLGLGLGVILGAFLHFAIQLPSLISMGFLPHFSLASSWAEIRPVLLVSLPRTLTLAAHQLALLVLIARASVMETGSIAVFNLALNLQSVPLAIVGVSYSVAAFPALAKIYTTGDKPAFIKQMAITIRHILFWSITGAVFFVVLRAQIVRVILGAGGFNWSHTRLTAAALALFALSVVAQSLVLLFVRGYYAAGRTTRPLVVNIGSSFAIVISSFLLGELFLRYPWWHSFIETLLRVQDVPGTDVLMLPLAYSLGLLINILIFWFVFQRDFDRFPSAVYRTIGESLLASVIGGAVAYNLLGLLAPILNLNTFNGILMQGVIAGLAGVAAWILILFLLGNEEIKEIWRIMHQKFWRQTPIASDATGL